MEEMASSNRKGNLKKKMKNKQRLGGNGLSLQAFANAKSNNSYNPCLIKKQREMYRNAKIVKKFKKSFKQQNCMENSLQAAMVAKGNDADQEAHWKNAGANKKKSSLQSVREEYEQKQEEVERMRRERDAMIQAKEEERARALSNRKALRESMFKKTRSGQPVMKYRIEHLLQGIMDS